MAQLPLHLPVERVNTEASAEDVKAGKYAAFPTYLLRGMYSPVSSSPSTNCWFKSPLCSGLHESRYVSREMMRLEEEELWCIGAGL